MTLNSSYTAAATSEITERLKKAVSETEGRLQPDRLQKLRAVTEHIRSLKERGLLTRQDYSAPSRADLERRYLSK
jgi:hypothetical protein